MNQVDPRIRERDGTLEFVVNLQHLPIAVETWFGGPSVSLIERYIAWLEGFLVEARASGRRAVFLHDASQAGMPSSEARQRITSIPSPTDVIIDRVIVFDAPVVRAAVSALGWITGSPYRTARNLDEGITMCRSLLERERIEQPPPFVLTPEQPS
ncbi:MAG TPA: hypothetical protein VK034_13615 [Enhygromyxa sp.]|nr:hypothetical protein [Enhygromyxa sp.]